jgi:hypothetical protein
MPIRINLLAEAIAEDDLRRRDPVKRAIYLGVFLVGLSLVWFSAVWTTYMMSKQSLNHIQAEIEVHTKEYTVVQNDLKKISEIQKRMDALDQLSAARFLQGNLLNALQQVYVPNVQLTRLRVDQSYTATAPAKANNAAPARPPEITEHLTLFMDAKDYSPNPGDQVNHYRDAIQKGEFFKPLIAPNGIRLSSLSALQSNPDSKPFVMFTIECRFADRNP